MRKTKYWLLVAATVACLLALGATLSQQQQRDQENSYGPAVVEANPHGDILYVHSTNGRNGDHGADARHPLLTLAYAITAASAGDTIILNPGGSETVTTTVPANLARLQIVCPCPTPAGGYTITGAGTVDLMTVSAADVRVSGVQFAHTGATATHAGVLTTADADGLRVDNCLFDDTAISATWTGQGVVITDACNDVQVVDCQFRDVKYGVSFETGTGKAQNNALVADSTFWTGQAAAFGVFGITGAGTVSGLLIDGCTFIEADGDGTAATAAWDGTDGTDGTQGPVSFTANVDQYAIANCVAYTALATAFDLLNAINAGAAGDLVSNYTGAGGDIDDALSTINTAVGTIDLTTTDNLHGKIGTDTEMGDTSLFDYLMPVESAGTADIDISESDYTGYVTLLTITPATGQSLIDVSIDFDWNLATTGWDTVSTAADTLDIAVVTKVDGTNWRGLMNGTQITANGDGTLTDDESGERFNIGMIGINGECVIRVKLSVERDDAEIPYRVLYRGAAPTITPVAAG